MFGILTFTVVISGLDYIVKKQPDIHIWPEQFPRSSLNTRSWYQNTRTDLLDTVVVYMRP